MLSTAIIIFREVFEIVLILGIVLAATRGLPGRWHWIGLGMAAGVGGSALVAYFTDSISMFAEGMGQEIFNAGILFTAAFFIGWTVLWMKRHAREMRAQITRLGADIHAGNTSFMALALVVALAMLREGSEIVLFSYGMLASGQSVTSLATGALLGGAGGLVVGLLLYFGLIQIPMKYFFQITGGLLMLLVAGMASQGMGFLVQAGYFDTLSRTAWDSSWLLSEHGLFGESLGVLLGYTSRPSIIQVMTYVAVLGSLIFLTRVYGRPPQPVPASGSADGNNAVPV